MKILHVIPESALDPRQAYLGSTKDILGRVEYFGERGLDFEQLAAPGRDDHALLSVLRDRDLSGVSAVLFEFLLYPRTMAWLRRHRPGLRLVGRAHNAEALHRLHWTLACARAGEYRNARFYAGYMLRRLAMDAVCSRRLDAVLSISSWETRRYWPWVGRGTVLDAPYFQPGRLLDPDGGRTPKERLCVCLLSTIGQALTRDAYANFCRLTWALGNALPERRFAVTGDLPPGLPSPPPRVEPVGLLASPHDILRRADVMAFISDYGYGFKTKVMEALLSGCRVLVGSGAFARLPEALQPLCRSVPVRSAQAFRRALEEEGGADPDQAAAVNEAFREKAFAALDAALGLAHQAASHKEQP